MRRGSLAVIAVLVAAAAPAYAGSPQLDRAEKAIDAVDYDAAKTLVEQALDQGGLEPADLARAHHLAGEVAAALGDDAGARDHFVRWLLLDPTAALPDGVSPKISAPFTAAKQTAASLGAMTIDAHVERSPGKVRVFLDTRDPAHMVAGLEVRRDDDPRTAKVHGTSADLPADDAAAFVLTVIALDEHDDQIVIRTVTVGPGTGTAAPAPTTPTSSPHRWPLLVRWPTWTVLAVVAAGAGGYFEWQVGKDHDALDALNADSANHTFDEALAIEDRGKAHARDADIGFAVGGALAAVAVITLIVEPHGKLEVAPQAGAGGAGLTARLRF